MLPPYFPQEQKYTCSLAVLRSVLAAYGKPVEESKLVDLVTPVYGRNFTNIWNPTLAKLACCTFGLAVEMYAEWPLFRPSQLKQALEEYEKDPNHFSFEKYENRQDNDVITEPLALAYTEMFAAIRCGCEATYGTLSAGIIEDALSRSCLVQTSVKLDKLYEGKKAAFHSILIYGLENGHIFFHDPAHGPEKITSLERLLAATTDVGAALVFGRR
jgi:hypothetical protein